MEDFDQVVTFHTHYGALRFRKRHGSICTLKPVPRSLSSSCGTAAFIRGAVDMSMADEYVEGIYEKEGDGWRRVM